MGGPVYFTAFYHQEETFRVFRQFLDCDTCHFFEVRLLGRVAVDVVSHFAVTE